LLLQQTDVWDFFCAEYKVKKNKMAKRTNQQEITKITDNTEYDFFLSENKQDWNNKELMTAPNGEMYNISLCVENRDSTIYKEIVKKYGDLKLVYTGKKILQNL
jgi:hypothetical protein